jgi:hypothetical protein
MHGDAVFERPGGTALTTGLLHMGIKWKIVTLPSNIQN